MSDHEWNGIGELAKSFGIVTTRGKEIGSGKQKELVQLLACKQEIGGKRIWGDNGLLTKTYSCLESAARAGLDVRMAPSNSAYGAQAANLGMWKLQPWYPEAS